MNRNRLLKESAFVLTALLALLLSTNIVSTVMAPMPTIKSCDKWGNPKNDFGPTESVYVCGDYYDPNEGPLTIYVVPEGSPLDSGSNVGSATGWADALGHLSPTDLGTFPLGKYDVWVDRNGDTHISAFEPADDWNCFAGFLVVPEYWLGPFLGLVACFAAFGVFRISKHRRD